METKDILNIAFAAIMVVLLIISLTLLDQRNDVIEELDELYKFVSEGDPDHCDITPYNPDCTCNPGERKEKLPYGRLTRWDCVVTDDLILDPDSETFQSDAIQYVKDYLGLYCGDICGDINCLDPNMSDEAFCLYAGSPPTGYDRCMSADIGVGPTGGRLANIECKTVLEWYPDGSPKSGKIPWRMNFFVESPTHTPSMYSFWKSYCVGYVGDNLTRCEPPMNIVPYNTTGLGGISERKTSIIDETEIPTWPTVTIE